MKRKKTPTAADLQRFDKQYSETGLFRKIGKFARRAGCKGALGYFILPFDFLPDLLPGAGMVDDWGALLAAVAYVATAITPEIKAKAKAKLADWFGSYSEADLGDLK